MARSQATQTAGQFWEMVKRLGDMLPKQEEPVGYHQDPRWFNQQIGALVKLDRHSEAARQIEAILLQGPLRAEQHFNPYADEKVDPRFFYPNGYQPRSVGQQVKTILGHLSGLDVSHVEALAASWDKYEQADGLYVVPKPSVLARYLSITDHWDNFGLLTEQGPLAALVKRRKFTNWRANELGPDRYRLADSAKLALKALEAEQPGDVLVFPAQTGKLFAGFSVRNARWVIEHAANPSQWPLPGYVAGWMVFANQRRLTRYEHLVIDCPGDELRFGPVGEFGFALYFNFDNDGLYCFGGWIDRPSGRYGSASGFAR